jgi:hypothetical protein
MGLYIRNDDVILRLIGKVRFTRNVEDENRMPIPLLERLINEAEGQVEQDLSPRYATPFVTADGRPFAELPSRPTREVLRTLCELQGVIRVLETDFGRGTATNGDNYKKELKERYDATVAQLLAKKKDRGQDAAGWAYPPLVDLSLNWFNKLADDGFAGSVIVASGSASHGYPNHQINNPAENFWNGYPPGWDHNDGKWLWEEDC